MKKCSCCGEIKQLSEYSTQKKSPDGLQYTCKLCAKEKKKEWRINNLEQSKAYAHKWYSDNKQYKNNYVAGWRKENKERIKELNHIWYLHNKEHVLQRGKRWNSENPEKMKAIHKRSNTKRLSTLKGILNNSMKVRIYGSLKNGTKGNRHWEALVDFTVEQLKMHLEKRFTAKMNWGNYGTYWHIDHKIPIAAYNFDRPDDIDFRLCWSLKNLQPLEAIENITKRDKLEKPFQPSLAM